MRKRLNRRLSSMAVLCFGGFLITQALVTCDRVSFVLQIGNSVILAQSAQQPCDVFSKIANQSKKISPKETQYMKYC